MNWSDNYLLFVHAIKYKLLLLILGKSKEAEVKRINKELANIRSKFKGKFFFVESEVYLLKGQLEIYASREVRDRVLGWD